MCHAIFSGIASETDVIEEQRSNEVSVLRGKLIECYVELFYHHFTPQKRVYSYEPPFMDFRNEYISEELAAEIEEKESGSAFKKILRKAGIRRG